MKTRAFAILILFCIALLANSVAKAQERLEIALFPYSKLDDVDISVVETLLQTKKRTLVEEFTQPGTTEFAYLKRLRIVPRSPSPRSDVELEDLWKRGSFLAFLMGGVVTRQGSTITLSTDIYLGELYGSYGRRTIPVSSTITIDQFRSVKDSHVIPTLFALALEARAEKKSSAIVGAFLNRARMIALDLGWDKRPEQSGGEISEKRAFFSAIEKELENLKTGK